MNRSNNNTLRKYKLVVLGNQNVGKTTLTYKLCEDKFLDNIEATIGVDLRSCFVKVGGEDIKVIKLMNTLQFFMLQGGCVAVRNLGYSWTREIP